MTTDTLNETLAKSEKTINETLNITMPFTREDLRWIEAHGDQIYFYILAPQAVDLYSMLINDLEANIDGLKRRKAQTENGAAMNAGRMEVLKKVRDNFIARRAGILGRLQGMEQAYKDTQKEISIDE